MGAGLVERHISTVFYAPTARRRYLSLKGAIAAEARARMSAKYPSEASESDEFGRVTHRGWHWLDDERLVRVFARYQARMRRAIRASFSQTNTPRTHKDALT